MTVQFETSEYEIGGVHTVVKAIGKGKPVLFLHGAATLEGFDFAEGLSDRFRVYCPSHPGMGYSGDAPHVSGSMDIIIHYLNLLDAMDLPEKPHLIGFSMGGWLATELAAVAGDLFDRVVLLAPRRTVGEGARLCQHGIAAKRRNRHLRVRAKALRQVQSFGNIGQVLVQHVPIDRTAYLVAQAGNAIEHGRRLLK